VKWHSLPHGVRAARRFVPHVLRYVYVPDSVGREARRRGRLRGVRGRRVLHMDEEPVAPVVMTEDGRSLDRGRCVDVSDPWALRDRRALRRAQCVRDDQILAWLQDHPATGRWRSAVGIKGANVR